MASGVLSCTFKTRTKTRSSSVPLAVAVNRLQPRFHEMFLVTVKVYIQHLASITIQGPRGKTSQFSYTTHQNTFNILKHLIF